MGRSAAVACLPHVGEDDAELLVRLLRLHVLLLGLRECLLVQHWAVLLLLLLQLVGTAVVVLALRTRLAGLRLDVHAVALRVRHGTLLQAEVLLLLLQMVLVVDVLLVQLRVVVVVVVVRVHGRQAVVGVLLLLLLAMLVGGIL